MEEMDESIRASKFLEVVSISRKITTPFKPNAGEEIIYRCTRDKGNVRIHPLNRQGYMVKAKSRDEAILKMRQAFPDDKFYGFTTQEWCPVIEIKLDERKEFNRNV